MIYEHFSDSNFFCQPWLSDRWNKNLECSDLLDSKFILMTEIWLPCWGWSPAPSWASARPRSAPPPRSPCSSRPGCPPWHSWGSCHWRCPSCRCWTCECRPVSCCKRLSIFNEKSLFQQNGSFSLRTFFTKWIIPRKGSAVTGTAPSRTCCSRTALPLLHHPAQPLGGDE